MPVLPVTNTRSSGMPSRTRFCWFSTVGARWNAAMRPISWRFSSSGNGVSVLPVRRPASTWPTGMRRLKDARRRRRVAVDEHPGREPSLAYLIAARHPLAGRPEAVAAEAVEVGHHGRHELVERQTGVAHAEVVIGLDRAELEDRRHQIGVLAGRHDDRAEDRAAPERQHDGEHLDRFGTRPDQDEEIVAPLAVHDRHAPRLADQVRTLHRCA